MTVNKNIRSIEEIEAVVACIQNGYVKGLIEGDFDTIMTSFHPDATMYGYMEGQLSAGSIRNLIAYVDQFGASTNLKARIDVVELTTTTAQARIELEGAGCGYDYTDYHQLMKIDGKWQVISKLFHAYDK